MTNNNKIDLTGQVPESWCCVDCGVNTAPGLSTRVEMESAFAADVLRVKAGVERHINDWSEVYTLRESVWRATGMKPYGGCLCIGCVEQRLGRRLRPKDFRPNHPFNRMPGTARLLSRRGHTVGALDEANRA